MPIDLTKLTPAPWVFDERIGMVSVFAGDPPECLTHECPRCIASKSSKYDNIRGWMLNQADIADMEFIALARNAFDVWMKNPHWAVYERGGKWFCDTRNEVFCTSDDPFSAILMTAKWYKENVEKDQ